MPQWNQPKWDTTTPNVIDNRPPFPELYIRNFVNDEGILPGELTPLKRIVDEFTATMNQLDFILSVLPSQTFTPIVYRNTIPLYPSTDYTINARSLFIPTAQTGDAIKVIYAN